MDERRTLIVISIVLFGCVVGLAAGTLYSQRGPQDTPGWHAKRFTAREGTTRENAQILTSNRRSSQSAAASGEHSRDPGSARTVASLVPASERAQTQEAQRARARQLAMEGNAAALESMLASGATEEERAQAGLAVAEAYLEAHPPQIAEAEAALATASALSLPAPLEAAIAATQARVLLEQKQPETARLLIEEKLSGLQEKLDQPGELLALQVLKAQASEAAGDSTAAIAEYEEALSNAGPPQALPSPTREQVRIAAMRLSRLYRSAGQTGQAQELAQRLGGLAQQ